MKVSTSYITSWVFFINGALIGISPHAVYEGREEYSYKLFAVRKEKVSVGSKGEGPLVSVEEMACQV